MDLSQLPPVAQNVVNLAYADLAIYAFALLPTLWITWKHGKAGLVCWPLLISFYVTRYISDIFQIVHRNEPLIPNVVYIMTRAGSLACLTLAIIGLLYEANTILPFPPRRWKEKIMLGVTHIMNTTGIALATYGSSPSATGKGGVMNRDLDRIGNCLMLFVLLTLYLWIWPTWIHIRVYSSHQNARRARLMLFAGIACLPFQSIRLAYNTTYAFRHIPSLDPVMGTFAPKFVLVFGTQLIVVLSLIGGGWLGMPFSKNVTAVDSHRLEEDVERSDDTDYRQQVETVEARK